MSVQYTPPYVITLGQIITDNIYWMITTSDFLNTNLTYKE
jgi:hypothetical protein